MIDYNCLIGHWPYRKMRKKSLSDIALLYDKYDIEYGYMANAESIFYHDPFEGDKELAEKLKNTKHKMVISMNVNFPLLERDFTMANQSFEYEGVRIYPSLHPFDFKSSQFDEFLHMVRENNKKLFVSYRMGDIRLDYMMRQQLPTIESIRKLIKNPYDNDIYLLNLKAGEVDQLTEDIKKASKVYFDSSDVKHDTFAMTKYGKNGLAPKCVFGSFFPLYTFESTYFIYTKT